MTTSIMTHNVRSVKTNGVSYGNSNAITLEIDCGGDNINLTLFGLPTDAAEHIDRCLNQLGRTLSLETTHEPDWGKLAAMLGLSDE